MEDALAQRFFKQQVSNGLVLILVVMEDALALLHPSVRNIVPLVLILIVMEDALAPFFCIESNSFRKKVLILVVMEDALALHMNIVQKHINLVCLNPCCNGRCTRTKVKQKSCAIGMTGS